MLTSCGSENSVLTVSESLCSGQAAVHAVAGEMKGISGLPEGLEFDSSKHLAEITVPEFVAVTRATAGSSRTISSGMDVVSGAGVALCAACVSASSAGETDSERHVSELPGRSARGSGARVEPGEGLVSLAGESEGIIGSLLQSESDFPSLNSSSLGSLSSACARRVARSAASAVARVCPGSSFSAVSAAVARAHAPTLHDACSNSWSDTVRVKGPTGTRRVKGGVSGPGEDLLPVSEVEAGVNFRPAGGVRGQVAGSLPRRQPGTGTRLVKGSVVTPSLHQEVPGIQFVSPGHGLDIRQSMGWTKVCGTAQSGIWVPKGNASARMFPASLDHLRVGWRKQGSYKTAWVTPGHNCLCAYKFGHGAAVRPQTNNAIWDGVIGLWGILSHPSCHLGVVRRMRQRG